MSYSLSFFQLTQIVLVAPLTFLLMVLPLVHLFLNYTWGFSLDENTGIIEGVTVSKCIKEA